MRTKFVLQLTVAGLALTALRIPVSTFALPCADCATNALPDELVEPPWPCDELDDEDANCDPPSANDGPGGDSNTNSPPCDCGMVTWRVSVPCTSLWLRDSPLIYRRSDSKWHRLELRFSH